MVTLILSLGLIGLFEFTGILQGVIVVPLIGQFIRLTRLILMKHETTGS